jgi:hypothetical protein
VRWQLNSYQEFNGDDSLKKLIHNPNISPAGTAPLAASGLKAVLLTVKEDIS